MLVAVKDNLYMCEINRNSALFVERDKEDKFSCYLTTWKKEEDGKRDILYNKNYITNATYKQAFSKAREMIVWHRRKGGQK